MENRHHRVTATLLVVKRKNDESMHWLAIIWISPLHLKHIPKTNLIKLRI